MKTKWIDKKFKYDGRQLRPLFGYLEHETLGDSIISWVGPCEVSFDHMVDGEDLLNKSEIRSSLMLHFIFEIFDRELASGVFLQRLFAATVKDLIEKKAKVSLRREGDDIYWDKKKLSISIATRSVNSVMIHFAMNVKNAGTPVPTCALEDWKLDPKVLAAELMKKFAKEYDSILEATWKVKSV